MASRSLLLLFCLFSVCSSPLSAGISDNIRQLEGRTLLVVIESPLKDILAQLNPSEQAAYHRAIENYNRKLKEVSYKFWSFNSKKEFKTWEEVDALIKNKADGYLLFYAGNYSTSAPAVNMLQKGLDFFPTIFTESDKRNYDKVYTSFKLCMLEDFKKNKAIVSRPLTNLWPLKEDIIFAFQYIQCLLLESKKSNISADAAFVASIYNNDFKTSTLLFKENLVDSTLVALDIQGNYPYQFGIVSHDSILNSIFEKQDVIYIEIVPVIVGPVDAYRLGYEHVLMNAKTGNVVAYVPASAGQGKQQKFVSTDILNKYLDRKTLNIIESKE